MSLSIKYWVSIFWLAARKFYNEYYTYRASALAFITVLSLIPFLSVMVYLATFFVDFSGLLLMVNHYLYDNFLPGPINAIQQYIIKFTNQATRLPVMSIVFSFISGVMLILTVQHSLNQIWHLELKGKSILTNFLCWVALLLLPFFIAASVILSHYIYSMIDLDTVKTILVYCFSIITNGTIFAVMYIAILNVPVKITRGFGWGIVTAALFEITKVMFVVYITYFTNYTIIYGALAAIPIFLVWIYIVWCIFLYGALLMFTQQSLEVAHIE